MNLNARCEVLAKHALEHGGQPYRVRASRVGGATVIDCGVTAPGGLAAGLLMARVCMADLASIAIGPGPVAGLPGVTVATDHPLLACMASQYAGWEVKAEGYFGMASGPMRAVAGREPLFEEIGYEETADRCFGVLESDSLPNEAACNEIAGKCNVAADGLTLFVAPTRSLAGAVQVVARSVETALHKLRELKFDLERVVSGWGAAPLPPPASSSLAAIGRTNDAILYGGRAVLFCRGDDASLREIGSQLPSSASKDFGRPFAEIMAAYDNDFYKIDPLLFSPAEVTLSNVESGNVFRFGSLSEEILQQSFGL